MSDLEFWATVAVRALAGLVIVIILSAACAFTAELILSWFDKRKVSK